MASYEGNDMAAYLFVDTFAFEKLVLQPECRIGQRDATMAGYETYLIEQWVCERKVNTVVASYTGNSQHVIDVQVLLVPIDITKWSQTTFNLFEQLVQMHILPKETKLGNMLVTSLSSLPSNLSLISMPQKYREGFSLFAVNENLRRLNVVGRIAVTADLPSDSAVATFRKSFAVHSCVPSDYAVLEVVTLMQISLFYFGLLSPNYVDGLLCDNTLKAIETWWYSIGQVRFGAPLPRYSEKLYFRNSCAALIGVVIGARQRLSDLGLKPPKDPFDAENFVVCIKRFQKMVKLPRTNQFDDLTYFKLVQETTKANTIAGSKMLTMMKSTVKEGLSGKASEAMDDWETMDIEVLAQNVRGERCKYLWLGKGNPVTPHLRASLPASNVGPTTKIPQFSLSSADFLDGIKHATPSRPSYHRRQTSSQNIDDIPQLPKAPVNVVSNGSLASAEAIADAGFSSTENLVNNDNNRPSDRGQEPHKSIVSRFRKRKPILGEAPEEPALQNSPQNYNAMTNSGHWFARGASLSTAQGISSSQSNLSTFETSQNGITGQLENSVPFVEDKFGLISDIRVSEFLTRDDLYLHPEQKLQNCELRRTNSMSEIECVLSPWDGLTSIPKLAEMYSNTQYLQGKVSSQLKKNEGVLEHIEEQIKQNESQLIVSQRDNVVLKYQFTSSSKKEEAVKRRMRELEAFMARLDYDLATLTIKLKDVDQSVLAFAAKVDSACSKWHQFSKVDNRSWWSRLLLRSD